MMSYLKFNFSIHFTKKTNSSLLTKKGAAKIILKLIYYEKPLLFLVFGIFALELIYTSCGIYKFGFSCIIRV